ncbi:MAG: lipopolysaccharide biosynthesis [Rhodobacteraceae bacterium]|jgi:uncharacterized protein involved in exopolysaccharide biosynthesis|nr:lipopolysaccharide biosynthesis [Paracoccaceae bacterium]
MNAEIKFYLTLFMRRLPLFIVVTGFFTAMGVSYAILTPNVWRAEATLVQERPQIANNLVGASGQPSTSEQLDLIEQRQMTRANLLQIAERHQVFENRAAMTPDQVVAIMRASTQFSRSAGSGQSIVLTVAFEGRTPQIAADVVGTFVSGILEENVRQRTGRAEDTLVFFQQEVDRLSLELDQRSAAILDFQNSNIDALPETLNYRLDQQASLQERIGQLNREIASLEDQRTRFTEIFEATGRLTGALQQRTPEEMELSAARIELEQARRVFAPGNPRLAALEQRVAVLEASIASNTVPEEGAAASSEATLFGLQMAEIDSRIAFNRDEIARLQASLATLQETIDRTPANTVQFQALQRDYANTQALYNAAVVNLSTARTSERIETLAKGERITVLSQATPPNNPVRPNRKLIAATGVAGGLAVSFGLIALLELLNRSIRRPSDLTRKLGIVPLVSVPYLPNRRETLMRRTRLAAAVLVVFIGIPAGLYTFHEQVMPLDIALIEVVGRLGL